MASGAGISGNLEKSGSFVPLEKSQGFSRNLEKSNAKLGKVREFYLCETSIAEASSKFIQVVNKN